MKNNLFTDAKTAVNLFRDMRKARKNGCNVEIRNVAELPFINCGPGFLNTVEGCKLVNGDSSVYENVKQVFDGLSYELKNKLIFSPKDGEFIARAQFWKSVLKPVMDPKKYSLAIYLILHWYIHIKQMRMEDGDAS